MLLPFVFEETISLSNLRQAASRPGLTTPSQAAGQDHGDIFPTFQGKGVALVGEEDALKALTQT